MRRYLLLTALLITACSSQLSLDRDAFESAAKKCRIGDHYFEPTKEEAKLAPEKSISPFRWFGDWWLQRRRHEQGVMRHYLVRVPAIYGGIRPSLPGDAIQRERANRDINCLGSALAPYGIEVRSTTAVIVE
jgi:hypothetical protein